MDSGKIKRLAAGARVELMAMASTRLEAVLAEGSDESLSDPDAVSRLREAVRRSGRERVVESAAYTWFNRLCALRYMDARGYTPTAVVTPRLGSTQPAVLADAAQGMFDPEFGFPEKAKDRVRGLLSGSVRSDNATEDAYGELLCAVCAHYAGPMGYLFSEDAASRLLMPPGLLSEGSILRRIVEDMDDAECGSVEVMGWLYQFYIAERKDEYFASKRKATREDIPAATQLFTPEWIVRYLAENSLGRLWMLNNPSSRLAERMDYYIAPGEGAAEPHIEVESAEEIRVLDPACGSGHILVYCFDLLFSMYEEEGWPAEDIPSMILRNNLKGLEIDGRAAELARFALEMKARERDPRFFERDVDADVAVLKPVVFDASELPLLSQGLKERVGLLDALEHMDEVGSLYVLQAGDEDALRGELGRVGGGGDLLAAALRGKLEVALADVRALSETYHCVVANPPYMGSGNMNPWLSGWVKKSYPDEKGDLCACFIRRGYEFGHSGSECAIVASHAWMFVSSYERMRKWLLDNVHLSSLVHLSPHGFINPAAQVCAFCFEIVHDCQPNLMTRCIRLVDFDRPRLQGPKTLEAIRNPGCGWFYRANEKDFGKIPGSPIAYWASPSVFEAFEKYPPLKSVAAPRQGLATGDNARFLRYWWEAPLNNIGFGMGSRKEAMASHRRWFPCQKGGVFRRWYGNNTYVVNWQDDGKEIRCFERNGRLASRPQNMDYYFHEGMTWGTISSAVLSMRYCPKGWLFETKGSMCFSNSPDNLISVLALTNSAIAMRFLEILSPTLDFHEGPLGNIPIKLSHDAEIADIAGPNIEIAKVDWDSFETSWDFESHPLCRPGKPLLERQYARWEGECRERFDTLKANEEELNLIFARIYHMEGEVPIEVPDDKVSVRLAERERDAKSLVSYAVGCMFGRYSLDEEGLVLADQGATVEDYLEKVPEPTFAPDADNVIPVLDGYWFEDNAADLFYRWLAAAYGEETLEENVAWVQDSLGCDIATYFSRHFYKDHLKTYQKRPIYWMFESPKKSFRCLVYMHRYNEGTVGEVLAKYVRPFEDKLRSRIALLDASDRARDVKEAAKLRAALDDVEGWERDVMYGLAHERISIDLDDGVKANYNKFPHALAKVPGLSEWK